MMTWNTESHNHRSPKATEPHGFVDFASKWAGQLGILTIFPDANHGAGISIAIPIINSIPYVPWCWNIYLQNWAMFDL